MLRSGSEDRNLDNVAGIQAIFFDCPGAIDAAHRKQQGKHQYIFATAIQTERRRIRDYPHSMLIILIASSFQVFVSKRVMLNSLRHLKDADILTDFLG